jgi:hypothetical protein
MTADAVVLRCFECGAEAYGDTRGCEGHLDDDGEDEVGFFCADCAELEFGVS